jgi:hypothetical protein
MDARSIRVPEDRIRGSYPAALALIQSAEAPEAAPAAAGKHAAVARFISPVAPAPGMASQKRTRVNLESILREDGDALLPPERHAVLFEARRALAVGMTIGELFVEPLGYLDLGDRNRKGTLHGADLDRFRMLVRAKALVSSFAAAAHMAATQTAGPAGEPRALGDIPLANTSDALGWLVHRLVEAVQGVPTDELDGAVARACADVMDRAEGAAPSAMGQVLADFASIAYSVEADGFHLHGFERPGGRRKARLDVQFKAPHEVVGNHIAKSQSMRLARMLASHDFETGKNPFVELGGFLFTFIGDGNPGTGKTSLIQMIAGLVKGYCDVAGYPFLYENFGVDQISEYQGKSGQNCRAFIERVLDPRAIGFGTIDDVDMVAGKRDDQRASGGQQEVTAVLMEAFSGPNTVIRGNCAFGMFSNYPEKVDDALRQRAGARWTVDGPQSREDYIDILHLLLGRNHKIPLGEHLLYAAQELKKMVAGSYAEFSVPQEEKLRTVWERIAGGKALGTIAEIGAYLHAIKEIEPRFTGRAIKNITDSVKYRAMDFDLPDEWFESPEPFLRQPYDMKLAMISELRRPMTVEMVLQEINRYAGSEIRYSDKSDETAIGGLVRDMRIRTAAAARYAEESGAR